MKKKIITAIIGGLSVACSSDIVKDSDDLYLKPNESTDNDLGELLMGTSKNSIFSYIHLFEIIF